MHLRYFLLSYFFLQTICVQSQTVTIYSNPVTAFNIVVGSSNYHVSESIYTNTEIGNTNFSTTTTSIKAISFYVASIGTYPISGSFKVYLKNISSTVSSFVSGSYNTTGYQLVASLTSFRPTSIGWYRINLTNPFVRISGTNLQMLIERQDGSIYTGSYTSSNGNSSLSTVASSRRYSGVTAATTNSTILTATNFRPAIQLINATPLLSVSPTSLTFGNVCVQTNPISRTFNLSGINLLAGNLQVGPLNGYTFSLNNINFTSTLTINQTGGTLAVRTIYVRFSPTAVQPYNGNIPISGGGATTVNVAVTGSGIGTVPTFTQISPKCVGTLFALPNTSNNGIAGTWSPAINTTTTTTYIFTPSVGQCATTTTMTVIINPRITPTFTQVAPICSGGTFTLPSTSNNGITGTWSPAINNTSTTTYTFTPTAGQCATTTTMTVTVNPRTTPAFTQVAPICSGGTFTLPSTSNNGITGTWAPAINNTSTTTYTFTPIAGQCVTTTIVTMTVSVIPRTTPIFTQVAPICSGGTFTLPATSNNGITGTWSPSINNTTTTTYTFTPSVQCANTTTMTVTVNQPVTPTFTQVASICRGGSFTLPTTSLNGVTGTWSPSINNTTTTTYTFTPLSTFCARSINMTVTVIQPTLPTFTIQPSVCSETAFTLPTTSNNGITGTWSPSINNTTTTTYIFTPTSGQCASTTTQQVIINPLPFARISSSRDTICQGSAVLLTALTSGPTVQSYQWFLNGSVINNATNSTYSASQPGSYTLRVTTSFGCTFTTPSPKILTLTTKPTADFVFLSYCIDSPVIINNTSFVSNSLPVKYNWNIGTTTSNLFNPTPIIYNTPGNITVSLSVTPISCPSLIDIKTQLLIIEPRIQNIRYPDVDAISNQVINLSARAFNNAMYLWTPSTSSLLNNNSQFVQFRGSAPTEFIIYIEKPSGCIVKDTLRVRMFNQADIFVPEAFSPNVDQMNDLLDIIPVGINKINYFIVYNRWGQKIYETSSINDKGWDGTYKGKPQPMGQYNWICEGVTPSGALIKRTGVVLLIR